MTIHVAPLKQRIRLGCNLHGIAIDPNFLKDD
jgi:hypothetical protein